jgi:hypothetical protein
MAQLIAVIAFDALELSGKSSHETFHALSGRRAFL